MSVRITCPSCGSSFFVGDEVRGQKIVCASCRKPMLVPAAANGGSKSSAVRPAVKPSAPALPPRRRLRDDDVDFPVRPPANIPVREEVDENLPPQVVPTASPSAPAVNPKLLLAGVIALVVVIAGLFGALWANFGRATPEKTSPVVAARGDVPRADHQQPDIPTETPHEKKPADGAIEVSKGSLVEDAAKALPAEVRERVQRATASIKVFLPGGCISEGTGFFGIEKGLVLTSARVLGMLRPDTRLPQRVQVACVAGGSVQTHEAKLRGIDRVTELAVLHVAGEDLPEPLDVKSARSVNVADKLLVVSLNASEQAKRQLSVIEKSVSGLRKEPGTDILQKVELNRSKDPGNAGGGPVVDARGDVIGVAVSGVFNTRSEYVVPGDLVRSIAQGRVDGITVRQPIQDKGAASVEVKLRLLDPLHRIRSLSLECWTGHRDKPRPASLKQPEQLPGDSTPAKVEVRYEGTVSTAGLLPLPALPAGQAYWIRPVFTNGAGQTTWGVSGPYELPPPVERKAATLALKAVKGVKSLHLSGTTIARIAKDREEHSSEVSMEVVLQEQTVQAVAGSSLINVGYQDAKVDIAADGNPMPLSDRLRQSIQGLGFVVTQWVVDRNGSLTKNGVVAPRLPPALRPQVLELHDIMNATLEAVTVPLPNKTLDAGQTWTALRPVPVLIGEKAEVAALEMTFTYLGTRTRDGKSEAVLDIAGRLKGVGNQATRYGGKADGLAVYDMDSGQVVQSHLSIHFDMDDAQARAAGTIALKLERK
jgi:S1-C subfamily serine protease